jgi:hypothetical protein
VNESILIRVFSIHAFGSKEWKMENGELFISNSFSSKGKKTKELSKFTQTSFFRNDIYKEQGKAITLPTNSLILLCHIFNLHLTVFF